MDHAVSLARPFAVVALALALAGCPLEPDPEPEPETPETDTSLVSRNELVYDQLGRPVLMFRFEQIREETPGQLSDATTTLFIENLTSTPLTFAYEIEVWSDLGYFQWGASGYVRDLPAGAGSDEGLVSDLSFHLRYARFLIAAR
jgi:hypothetical protein